MATVHLGGPVHRIGTLGSFINSFALLEDDGSVTLVDCGLDRAPARIVAGLEQLGKHPNDVQRIVLTHAHNDHAGGAQEMVERSGVAGVEVHSEDADFVRAGQAAPGATGSLAYKVLSRLNSGAFAPVAVDRELHDGEMLDIAGGLQVHHTPGHTPGHVSLLHADSGVLITGDVIFNVNLRITWPFKAFCTSFPLNKQSAHVLAEVDYQVAAFTHGPEIRDRARERVRTFVAKHS